MQTDIDSTATITEAFKSSKPVVDATSAHLLTDDKLQVVGSSKVTAHLPRAQLSLLDVTDQCAARNR